MKTELAMVRNSATIITFGRDSKAGRGIFFKKLENGRDSDILLLRLLVWERWRRANEKQDITCAWFGDYI